jgi:hypothetical protein
MIKQKIRLFISIMETIFIQGWQGYNYKTPSSVVLRQADNRISWGRIIDITDL